MYECGGGTLAVLVSHHAPKSTVMEGGVGERWSEPAGAGDSQGGESEADAAAKKVLGIVFANL